MRRMSIKERLEKHSIHKSSGCIEWTAYKIGGYGSLQVGNKNFLAHRLSWECSFGSIPAGKHVLHRCDNPSCINVDHLFIGTHRDNMRDKVSKGRHSCGDRRGEKHHLAKLTKQQVQRIRILAATGNYYQRELAAMFGISREHIGKIVRRQTW